MKIHNPILPGFHPDPSVCRVGEDYFLVTSSFEYFPGLPLFHSRDLAHWRPIGHCLTRPGQHPLAGVPASGGVYAPTIRHRGGRFYVACTNVTHGGHFIVSAADPAGEWSDPVRVEQEGIDPSLFFDDDGAAFFTGTGKRGITQSVVDPDTGRLLEPPRAIWPGSGGRYPEGPHLYKVDGLYYLVIAEGGTEYGHMETVARSRSPWGPFEPCPRNPVLTQRDRARHPVQAAGHADLVQAGDGTWWAVFLGIRPVDEFYHHLGRETFLTRVTWAADGWPSFVPPELEFDAPGATPRPWPPVPARDDFSSGVLGPAWNFIRNPDPADWSLAARPGFLRLLGSATTLDRPASPAFVGRRQEHFDAAASARLEFEPAADGEEAGLTVFMNERHHCEIFLTRRDGRRVVAVRRLIGDLAAETAAVPAPEGPVELSVRATPSKYVFVLRSPGGERPLAEAATRYLSKEVAGGFTGVYFGMYAAGPGRRSGAPADFDWFDYSPAGAPAGA